MAKMMSSSGAEKEFLKFIDEWNSIEVKNIHDMVIVSDHDDYDEYSVNEFLIMVMLPTRVVRLNMIMYSDSDRIEFIVLARYYNDFISIGRDNYSELMDRIINIVEDFYKQPLLSLI
jgi:hypothetical protein